MTHRCFLLEQHWVLGWRGTQYCWEWIPPPPTGYAPPWTPLCHWNRPTRSAGTWNGGQHDTFHAPNRTAETQPSSLSHTKRKTSCHSSAGHLRRFGAQTIARFFVCMFVTELKVARRDRCLMRNSRVLRITNKANDVVVTFKYFYQNGKELNFSNWGGREIRVMQTKIRKHFFRLVKSSFTWGYKQEFWHKSPKIYIFQNNIDVENKSRYFSIRSPSEVFFFFVWFLTWIAIRLFKFPNLGETGKKKDLAKLYSGWRLKIIIVLVARLKGYYYHKWGTWMSCEVTMWTHCYNLKYSVNFERLHKDCC